MTIEPFAWKNRPSLIESILPAQKISAEAQKERKGGTGQSLTALGSYWKGRKPLILVKACVLGTLLPATDDPAADLAIFEKLMAIDDEAFLRREFGSTPLRALLFALFELQREVDSDEVMAHLRELVPGYLNHREDLMAFCQYLGSKREGKLPEEAGAARVLLTRIKNERLGG